MSTPVFLPDIWSNWINDHPTNALRFVAKNKQDLLDAVTFAVQTGKRVRAIGSGHSMSKCAQPDELFVVVDEISGLFRSVKWLKQNPPGLGKGQRLVRVKAGTRLKTLNRILLPNMGKPAGLINMGAFDGQTLAGAVSTATHGSGMAIGSLADMVVSVDMVTVTKGTNGQPYVQMRRFEPSEGVTDRDAFNAERAKHRMVLEQDDETFNAAVVSYGCMGIAYAYTIKVRDEYWLSEDTSLAEWPTLRAQLKEPIISQPGIGKQVPQFVSEDRHFQLLINVAEAQGKKGKEDIACNVIRRNIVQPERKPSIWLRDGWPPERRNPFLRNLLKGLLGGLFPPRAHKDNDAFGQRLRNQYFEKEAKEEPFVSNRTATVSYICLKRERDTSKVDKAPDPPDAALSLEIAVPAEHVALAVDTIIDAIRAQDWFFAIPLGVRFVASSSHYLAPNYGRSTAFIEVPFLQVSAKLNGEKLSPEETIDRIAKPALKRIEVLLKQHSVLKGRPHLGKYQAQTRDDLKQQYANHEKWEAVFRRFNQFGTFENAFTDQLGLTGLR
jgi:hypothetical protein